MGSRPSLRVAVVAVGMTALLAGLWAGLLRLGWPWPILRSTLPVQHGPLMVSGFLGTLIRLERAVALGSPGDVSGAARNGLRCCGTDRRGSHVSQPELHDRG
jgi:hypothetical protein